LTAARTSNRLDYHKSRGTTSGRAGRAWNAVINGHVNWWTGDAVFTYLARVRSGDRIEVVARGGRPCGFESQPNGWCGQRARRVALRTERVPTLTLITCTGVWDAWTFSDTQRLLVSAVLA